MRNLADVFWKLERVPEPEEMNEAAEVQSYSSAAAAAHLEAIDDTFVEHLLRLLPKREAGNDFRWGLDVGTGPAQIPIKILRKIPSLKMIGLERSPAMLATARRNAQRDGVGNRILLLRADAHSMPFRDGVFSMVVCNSVLHHVREPLRLLQEIFRVAAPDAPVLLRDLRRPPRPLLRWHLWRHGRHYHGLMRRLFEDSVRAAYTAEELADLLKKAGTGEAAVFRFGDAHIGVERPAR
ncbi:MAG: class I SAM-dependent methyltransferase [Acidobacteria bacterium]|nr:class I SAM-dependent methyltransferase [Acidobacteriota bacterium]